MAFETRDVRPCAKPGHVVADGAVLAVPAGWSLLPPGEAALSRRVKEDGPSWTMLEMKGRKRFSRGIWAPADRIEKLRAELLIERQDPSYQKKLDAGRRRRAAAQEIYVEDFRGAVIQFLAFSPRHATTAEKLAGAITAHAVPVGSGTVARTQRIPLESRAASATIAWLRHRTTAYDQMNIPREKGRRREVRRMLAQHAQRLLDRYRQNDAFDQARCPLHQALHDDVPNEVRSVQTRLF